MVGSRDPDLLTSQFRLPGYQFALEQVILAGSTTITYGHMPFSPRPPLSYTEGPPMGESRQQLISGKEVNTQESQSHDLIIANSDCLEGNYHIVFDQLANQCIALAPNLEQMRLRSISESCAASQQEIQTRKNTDPLDQFLDALARTRIPLSLSTSLRCPFVFLP